MTPPPSPSNNVNLSDNAYLLTAMEILEHMDKAEVETFALGFMVDFLKEHPESYRKFFCKYKVNTLI